VLLVANFEALPADRASLSGCRNFENGVSDRARLGSGCGLVSAASIALRGLGARG